MSDPIVLHSNPLSKPLDSTATNQPPATGQFQQLSTQRHEGTNQMPASAGDAGKQKTLQERSVRRPVDDAFLSEQENMIKASKQRLEDNQNSLQAHKDRFSTLSSGSSLAALTGHKPTQASTAESLPKAVMQEPAHSVQARLVSDAATVSEEAAQAMTAASKSGPDSTANTGVSPPTGDTEKQTDGPKGKTTKVTARVVGARYAPNTKVTTTSIVTKTVTTTETIPDRPASPSSREAPGVTPAPQDGGSTISLPGLSKSTPALELGEQHGRGPSRYTSHTSLNTSRRESASSAESAEFHMASSTIVDPDAQEVPERSREITIAHGEKNKFYSNKKMPKGSTLKELQEAIDTEVAKFRKDKRRSRMLVQVTSQEEGKEGKPIYVNYEETSHKKFSIRQTRTPGTEIAKTLSSGLADEERKAADQLKNAMHKDGKPEDKQIKDEQTGAEQVKDGQAGAEQVKDGQADTEQVRHEQTGG